MPDYNTEINKLQRNGKNGSIKTEIWAEITERDLYDHGQADMVRRWRWYLS